MPHLVERHGIINYPPDHFVLFTFLNLYLFSIFVKIWDSPVGSNSSARMGLGIPLTLESFGALASKWHVA